MKEKEILKSVGSKGKLIGSPRVKFYISFEKLHFREDQDPTASKGKSRNFLVSKPIGLRKGIEFCR